MDGSKRCFLAPFRKWTFETTVIHITLLTYLSSFLVLEVESGKNPGNCPIRTTTLFAYPEGDTYSFQYTFDPLIKTSIDLIDRFLTSDDDVECTWEIRAKEGHNARITIEDFKLSQTTITSQSDCLVIYDGQSKTGPVLEKLCGGETPKDYYQSSEDRYLFLVFSQGKKTGKRSFSFRYEAIAFPKDKILKIASIVSGCVAAVGVIILAFKFTRNCRPCRKRCCPDEENVSRDDTCAQRELRPLSPPQSPATPGYAPPLVMPDRANIGSNPAQPTCPQLPYTMPGVQGGGMHDPQFAPPPDEAPPSYDSIFGQEDRNK